MHVCRKYFRNKDMIPQVILMCGICVCSVIKGRTVRSQEENGVSELDILSLRVFYQVKMKDFICLMNACYSLSNALVQFQIV